MQEKTAPRELLEGRLFLANKHLREVECEDHHGSPRSRTPLRKCFGD